MSERRDSAHGQQAEPLLEPWLAMMRYRATLRILRRLAVRGELEGLDYGCGYHGRFVRLANRIPGVRFRGCDISVDPDRPDLFRVASDQPDILASGLDVITMHAVLEHLDNPRSVIGSLTQLLAPRGVLLLTVPSIRAKPVLEFLAFRLGVISRTEIEDHKQYYDRSSLELLLGDFFPQVRHRYFQFGLNNRVEASRTLE